MPEGHTIHRVVVDQSPALAGRTVAVSSPNGRFSSGAAALDGRTLESMDAWGKHLFYFFEGRRVLHVHLGMDGRFHHHRTGADLLPRRSSSVWLRVSGPELTFDLSSPRVCELIDEVHQHGMVAGLGPDPIRSDSDGASFVPRMRADERPIGAALLDQSLIAGVGSVYRAEILFALGVHPERPASTLTEDVCSRLWDTAARMLRAGVRDRGRIITVDPRDFKVRDRRQTYVYGQRMCAHCGSPVRRWDLLGREAWACETCQPLHDPDRHPAGPSSSASRSPDPRRRPH